nr:transferrin-like [Procambarus clarkii]
MVEDLAATTITAQCVLGDDRYHCLRMVMQKQADVMRAEPEDVFLARELYNSQIHVLAETRTAEEKNEAWRYQGVAVIRRSKVKSVADLKGSKSCHTGYARNAGWNIPFSHLLEKGEIKLDCTQERTVVEHDLKAASSYFGLACIPGDWTPDNETDARLKEAYNNLCTMCGNPGRCDNVDEHAGYAGALRCLVESHGDVAWTKLSAVTQYFKIKTDVSTTDFGLLCPDGRILDLDSTKPCHWAARPWNSWIARASNENKKGIVSELTKLVTEATLPAEEGAPPLRPWAKAVLGIDSPSVIHARSPPITPHDYLKEPGYDATIERLGCSEVPVKLCVDSQLAKDKCLALSQVLKSRRIRPALECVMPASLDDCLTMVASGSAHITTVDGGDVFRGHVEYGLVPVISERYGQLDASYFAVAVVHANSGITSLSQLQGKKSCHTGIDKTAGWKIPVVTLLEAGLLKAGNCDYAGELGNFFSSSCAPGAKDPKYDPKGTNPQSLCDLCVGNDVAGVSGPAYSGASTSGKCERSDNEAFYGYTGAFRCLVQGGGDVTFVKHSTVQENTNGNNEAEWAKNLRALDFKLLCKDSGTADIVDYNTCHLARVPSHKVLTGIKSNSVMLEEIRILLLRASQVLPKGQDVFTMFGPFQGRQDVIFKDSATELVNVRQDTFHQSLEDSYYRALTELSTCRPKETQLHFTMTGGALAHGPFYFLHLVVCAVIVWLHSG